MMNFQHGEVGYSIRVVYDGSGYKILQMAKRYSGLIKKMEDG